MQELKDYRFDWRYMVRCNLFNLFSPLHCLGNQTCMPDLITVDAGAGLDYR